jgi:Family of unknown function (DUF5677)
MAISATWWSSVACYAESGASQAAEVHLRGSLEALLYIEFILQKDTSLRGRRLYISMVRTKRRQARRFIPKTKEHEALNRAWLAANGVPYELTAEKLEAGAEGSKAADEVLSHPANAAVNAEFDAFAAKKNRREAKWHELGDGGVGNIRDLAKAVNREAEYQILYSSYSESTHGSYMDDHFRKSPEGLLAVQPIRDPARLNDHLSFSFTLPMIAYKHLTERYRPGELEVYTGRYMTKWKPFTEQQKIVVNYVKD